MSGPYSGWTGVQRRDRTASVDANLNTVPTCSRIEPVFGEEVYPDLHFKAAVLLEGVNRNHSLLDGNKRLSWATTLAFYAINGYDLRPTNNAVTFVRGVAAGTVPLADAATWLKSHARPFNDDWTKARPIRPAPARHFRLP